MSLRTETVTFSSEGETLVGDLHLPTGTPEGTRLPAVVLAGSWTTVRQQMPTLYARRLAERGYAALAFDFRGFGESSGEPRGFESPNGKVTDIRNAVTFLTNHPAVDAGRIGALGICAGSGYVAVDAADDDRIRSLALVAPWLHDAALVEAIYGGPDAVAERVALGERAGRSFRETGEPVYVPAVSTTDPEAAMYGPLDYYLNAERGAVPEWDNRFAVQSWPGWLTFDPIAAAPKVRVPTLLVHSEDGAVPDGARRFHDDLAGPKQFLWLTGSQFDFYDDEPTVAKAVDAAVAHYATTL